MVLSFVFSSSTLLYRSLRPRLDSYKLSISILFAMFLVLLAFNVPISRFDLFFYDRVAEMGLLRGTLRAMTLKSLYLAVIGLSYFGLRFK